jgi:hypothetical protein
MPDFTRPCCPTENAGLLRLAEWYATMPLTDGRPDRRRDSQMDRSSHPPWQIPRPLLGCQVPVADVAAIYYCGLSEGRVLGGKSAARATRPPRLRASAGNPAV